MQGKSADLCSVPARLERLRVETQSTWVEIAARVGLSESMIYQVKSGKRALSAKALYRLAVAETESGIKTPLAEQLESVGTDDEIGDLRRIFERGDWSEDLDAQLAAILGEEVLAQSVLASWSVLEDFLNAFLHKISKVPSVPNEIREEISPLRNQLKGFRFDLERLVERAKRGEESSE